MMEREREQVRISYLTVTHHTSEEAEGVGGERYPVLPEVMLPRPPELRQEFNRFAWRARIGNRTCI